MAQDNTRTFTKTINGEEITAEAHTAADAVRFTYDGWREVVPAPAASAAPAKKTTAAAKQR